jgi:hypothetical protein
MSAALAATMTRAEPFDDAHHESLEVPATEDIGLSPMVYCRITAFDSCRITVYGDCEITAYDDCQITVLPERRSK